MTTAPRLSVDEFGDPGGHLGRVVASSTNEEEWLRARAKGVTATDAARLATTTSVEGVVRDKLHPDTTARWRTSAYLEYGRERENAIGEWARARYGFASCGLLFHSETNLRHLATPDGTRPGPSGSLELCEIKTSSRPWNRIPRHYLRQVWWQQYVLGTERTLVVWEEHRDFVPIAEPRAEWVCRDEGEIARLCKLADAVLAQMDAATRPSGRRGRGPMALV